MMETKTTQSRWSIEDNLLRLLQLVSIEPGIDLAGDLGNVHGSQVQAVVLVPYFRKSIAVDRPWALV